MSMGTDHDAASPADVGGGGDTATPTETPFPVADQIYFLDGTGSHDWEIKLTSYTGACTLEHDGDSKKQNSDYINIELEGSGDGVPPAGTYMLGSNANGVSLSVELKHDDGTCNQTDVDANSGTLVLTTSTESGAAGTLTASIEGKAVQFEFNAAGCTRDDAIPFSCVQ